LHRQPQVTAEDAQGVFREASLKCNG